jgi:acid phosphatase type 7
MMEQVAIMSKTRKLRLMLGSKMRTLMQQLVFGLYLFLFLMSITGCRSNPAPTVTTVEVPTTNQVHENAEPQAETPVNSVAPTPGQLEQIPLPVDLFAQSYPPSEISFAIPISLRHVMEQQATFFFELQNPSQGKLVYRKLGDPQSQKEVLFSEENIRQMITLTDLLPGERYEARILIGGELSGYSQPEFRGKPWPIIQFKTASNVAPLRIAVLGDASFGDDATRALVQLIASQDLDFVIHTGDVVYETESSDVIESYAQKFFEPFSPLLQKMPVYTVLGNHDYDSAVSWQGAPFYDVIFPPFPSPDDDHLDSRRGNQYYAFSYQGIQFLMLDTHVFAGGGGRAEQDEWLEQRLADPRYRFTIPVFHVAPYSSSSVHPTDGLPVRDSWDWRFEESNVPLTLSGHFHGYERVIVNGITYLVTGGGSSTLYAQGDLVPGSQGYQRKTHFVLLEIYTDFIDLKAIDLSGEIIDQARIDLIK